ncbi:MAG: histidine kinase dimerization/phospho-acceptor domain-containing protein, partial [Candidatus Margulisiibacteriota bacterium]
MFKSIRFTLFISFVGVALVSLITLRLAQSTSFAFLTAVIVAVIVSVAISRYFSDPIVRLSEIAKRISEGDFTPAILQKSTFEIRDLEEAISSMSIRLNKTFNRLSAKSGQVDAVLSSMTEGVLAVDRDGKVILANPVIEKVLNVTEPEIIGKTIREVIWNNEITGVIEKSLKNKAREIEEIAVLSPFEGIFVANVGPIIDKNEKMLGVVCVLSDVTEIRKLEKYRSEFVANVSHELKTPLTAIRGYVETLIGGAINDKEHNQEFLGKIEKHAQNLSDLIDDILHLSTLESKRDIGTFVKLEVGPLITKALETISVKAKRKGVRLERKCLGDGVYILGIEDHVYRSILNLLSNAVNYCDKGGEVAIACGRNGDKTNISISDNGVGISE